MMLREICREFEISRRTVQGYEKAGLVSANGRNKYGHLQYDDNAIQRIAKIKFYQQLGFSLKEIIEIIDAPDAVLKARLEKQVETLNKEKEEMQELIEKAEQMIKAL